MSVRWSVCPKRLSLVEAFVFFSWCEQTILVLLKNVDFCFFYEYIICVVSIIKEPLPMPRIGGRLTEEQRGRSYGSRYTYVHWEATQPVITIYAFSCQLLYGFG